MFSTDHDSVPSASVKETEQSPLTRNQRPVHTFPAYARLSGNINRSYGTRACDVARILIEELTESPVERRCEANGECPQCKFVIDAA